MAGSKMSMKQAVMSLPHKRPDMKRFIPIYIMALPGIAYLVINNYLPMFGIIIAFKNLNFRLGIFKSPWAGL
jgi:putative aldouronate transport system permease protein